MPSTQGKATSWESMLKRTPITPSEEIVKKLEAELLSLEDTLQTLEGVEGTLITITPIDYDPILVGSIYIPPINNYFRNLGAALDTIFNFNNKTILVGDFNAKHTSWVATVATPEASSTSEIENEVRELTSEILTAHGNASKPVTHSKSHLCRILPECLEDCSGGPDSQTWERSHVSGIPPTYFLTPLS
ncbi:hypothetical protein TNCV_3058531 [Trichonephila clavipes]|nr:hypothetical protein TNCV_3058531 [Trichonephila clavipes]